MKLYKYFFVCLLAASCAQLGKPTSLRKDKPAFSRGWGFIEPENEFLSMNAGVNQVSYSAPILHGNKVIFGSDRFGLTALSEKNGKILWQKRFSGAGVSATPFLFNDKVIVGTDTGLVSSFDAQLGTETWKQELSGPVHGAFAFSDGRLFVGTADEAMHALDISTGKVLWTYRRNAFSGTSIRGGGNPSVIQGKVWTGFSDGTLVALNIHDGRVEFEKQYRDNPKFFDLDAKVLSWRDGILFPTYDGSLRYLRMDGSTIWEQKVGGARAAVIGRSGKIYLPSSDGAVYAIDGSSGKILWQVPLPTGVPTSIILKEGEQKSYLIVGSSKKYIYALNPDTGEVLDRYSLGSSTGTFSPLLVDEEYKHLYLLSMGSRIYQFRLNW
ncbi:MAG: PQQ-binding-like beta-propeller repeat protein [Oligoflexia bacterium]|nr:PQQ-binding-like beta-propeller repeat protein [Oligoflexia bacterium]